MLPVRLSIVMPVLDEAPIVAAALQVLAPLRQQGAELIVVDGQSSDGSAAVAAASADLVVVTPSGRARQMNAGAARARGDVLLFLHVDTALPPRAVALVLAALDRGAADEPAGASDRGAGAAADASVRSAGGAAGAAVWGRFDVEIAGRGRMLGVVAMMMNLRSRITGIATGDQALFVDRAAFDAVGGFPEQPLMEDVELSKRLRRIGAPACLRAKVITSGRRWERRGTWRTIVLMWGLRLLYRLGVAPERLARAYRSA